MFAISSLNLWTSWAGCYEFETWTVSNMGNNLKLSCFLRLSQFLFTIRPFGKATAPDANISSSERNMSVAPLSRNSNKLRRSWYSNSSWLIQNFSLGDFTSFANLGRSGQRMDSQATKQSQSNLEKGTDSCNTSTGKINHQNLEPDKILWCPMLLYHTQWYPWETFGNFWTFHHLRHLRCALVGTANVNVLLMVVYQTWGVCIWSMLLSCCFSLVNASLRKISGPNSNRVGCYSWRPRKSSRRLTRNSTQEFMRNLPSPVCFAICQCNARSMPTQCHCLMTTW